MITKKHVFLLSILILLCGCSHAKETLTIYTGDYPAIVYPSEEIDILKIDEQMVEVKPEGSSGSPYCRVALKPGKHRVVVHLPGWNEGSVYFLNAHLIGGRNYMIKYKIMERLKKGFIPGNTWRLHVWIEDVEDGKEVSIVERNL